MSYTYHGTTDLITLPNRTVQTYPSGLVRVERSFVCRKADASKYRKILQVNTQLPEDNGAPAIDGLYIFPEPQETMREDGFIEFRVTAYGRTSKNGALQTSYILGGISFRGSISIGAQADEDYWIASSNAMMPQFTQKIVLQNNEIGSFAFSLDTDIRPASVEMYLRGITGTAVNSAYIPYDFWETYMMTGPSAEGLKYQNSEFVPTGEVLFSGKTFKNKKITKSTLSKEISSTNFGIFNEYTITYRSFFFIDFIR